MRLLLAFLPDHLIRTRHHGDARALLHPLNAVCRKGENGAAWLTNVPAATGRSDVPVACWCKAYDAPDVLMAEIRATVNGK